MYGRYNGSPNTRLHQPSKNLHHFNNEVTSGREHDYSDGGVSPSFNNASVNMRFESTHLERENSSYDSAPHFRWEYNNFGDRTTSPCFKSCCLNTSLENSRLKRENLLLNNRLGRIQEIESEMKGLRRRYHTSLENNASLEKKIKQKEKEVWALEVDVVEQEGDIVNLEAAISRLETEVWDLQCNLYEEQKYSSRLDAFISRLETEVGELKHILYQTQRNNNRMRAALQKKEEDIALRDKALDQVSRNKEALQNKIKTMENSIKFGNIKKKDDEIQKLETSRLSILENSKRETEKLQQIEDEKQDLLKKIGRLQNQLHSREADYNSLRQENRSMQILQRSAATEVNKSGEELEKVRLENKGLKSRIKELEDRLTERLWNSAPQRNKSENESEMHNRELTELKKQNKELEEGNRRMLQEKNDLKMMHSSAISQKDKEIDAAKEKLEKLDVEMKSLRSKLRDSEQTHRFLTTTTSDYQTVYEENKNLEREKTNLEEILQECQKSLKDAEGKLRRSESTLLELKKENGRLEDDLLEMKKEEKKWLQRNSDIEEKFLQETRHLEENLNKLRSENRNLQAENASLLSQKFVENEKQLNVTRTQTLSLQGRVKQLESENSLLQNSIANISKEKESALTSQYKAELERRKSELEVQQKLKEVQRLQKCIAQKEEESKKLEREHSEVLKGRDSALKRLVIVEQELRQENQRLKEELNQLQSNNEIFQEENRSASVKLSKFEEQMNTMKIETRRLQEKITELSAENSNLRDDIAEVSKEKDNALTRLSKVAGAKLTHGNAAITDLSDTNRPTKLAEKFSELYDNQWTDAFEELDNTYNDEEETIQVLLKILKEAYNFCVRTETNYETRIGQAVFTLADENTKETRQITGADVPVQKALTDLRLSLGNACCLIVEEMFLARLPTILKKVDVTVSPKTKLYARQCASLCWRMRIRDPPVFVRFEFRRGTEFNTDMLRRYTKTGGYVDFIVWPALYLHENGPVLSKGVAQPKHTP